MGLGLMMKMDLIQERHDLNLEMTQIGRERRALGRAAAILADGVVSLDEIASVSVQHMPFVFDAMGRIYQEACVVAEGAVAQADIMRAQTNATGQPLIPHQQIVYNAALKQAMADIAKRYQEQIKEEEKRLEEKQLICQQKQKELEGMEKLADNIREKSNQTMAQYVA